MSVLRDVCDGVCLMMARILRGILCLETFTEMDTELVFLQKLAFFSVIPCECLRLGIYPFPLCLMVK